MSTIETDFINRLGSHLQNNDYSNDMLVEIIKLSGGFLNLKTISQYSKDNNLSYQGVKTCRNVIELFGCKLVIDNE